MYYSSESNNNIFTFLVQLFIIFTYIRGNGQNPSQISFINIVNKKAKKTCNIFHEYAVFDL